MVPASIICLATTEVDGWIKKICNYLGGISYPLYIVHLPIFLLVTSIPLISSLDLRIEFLVLVIVTILITSALSPLEKRMRSKISNSDYFSRQESRGKLYAGILVVALLTFMALFLMGSYYSKNFPDNPSKGYLTNFNAENSQLELNIKLNKGLQGFYAIDGDVNQRSAWVGPEMSINLTVEQGKSLWIEGWIPANLISVTTKNPAPQVLTIKVNGVQVRTLSFINNEVISLEIPWQALSSIIAYEKYLNLEIYSSVSVTPSRYSSGGDSRNLSYKISRIEFR